MTVDSAKRRYRFTARARLTTLIAVALSATSCAAVIVILAFMRFVPSYEIGTAEEVTGTSILPSPVPSASGAAMLTAANPAPFTLMTGDEILATLLTVSIAVLIVISALGVLVGWFVAGRMLRPLSAINDAARRAADGSLDHRVALSGPRDEFTELSDTFDRMLDGLQAGFAMRERFAANASHELKTPLATTKAMVDVALADPTRSAADLRRTLIRVAEANQRNIETVHALLDLAQTGNALAGIGPVDLSVVVADAVEQVAADAAARTIDLTIDVGPAIVEGDSTLLERMVSNLVRNGIVHNVDGGRLSVRVYSQDDLAVVIVDSTGHSIPDASVHLLTEPFAKGDGRVHSSRGHGLGLALVQQVVSAHGGTLDLHPNAGGGLLVKIAIPAS